MISPIAPAARFALVGCAAFLVGCARPEAARVRGGGAGADVGNRKANVQLHGGSSMYHATPCRMPEAECPGPLPASGLPGDFPVQRTTRR